MDALDWRWTVRAVFGVDAQSAERESDRLREYRADLQSRLREVRTYRHCANYLRPERRHRDDDIGLPRDQTVHDSIQAADAVARLGYEARKLPASEVVALRTKDRPVVVCVCGLESDEGAGAQRCWVHRKTSDDWSLIERAAEQALSGKSDFVASDLKIENAAKMAAKREGRYGERTQELTRATPSKHALHRTGVQPYLPRESRHEPHRDERFNARWRSLDCQFGLNCAPIGRPEPRFDKQRLTLGNTFFGPASGSAGRPRRTTVVAATAAGVRA